MMTVSLACEESSVVSTTKVLDMAPTMKRVRGVLCRPSHLTDQYQIKSHYLAVPVLILDHKTQTLATVVC